MKKTGEEVLKTDDFEFNFPVLHDSDGSKRPPKCDVCDGRTVKMAGSNRGIQWWCENEHSWWSLEIEKHDPIGLNLREN